MIHVLIDNIESLLQLPNSNDFGNLFNVINRVLMDSKLKIFTPLKLFLLKWWALLKSKPRKEHVGFGESCLFTNFNEFRDLDWVTIEEIDEELERLKKDGVIEELLIFRVREGHEKDAIIGDKFLSLLAEDSDVERSNRIESLVYPTGPIYDCPEKGDTHFLNTSPLKVSKYIEDYLYYWRNNLLRIDAYGNSMKAEKQLESVVSTIYKLIEDYPHDLLALREAEVGRSDLDFMACVCFLERIGAIDLLEVQPVAGGALIHINIRPKFFVVFPKTSDIAIDMEILEQGRDQDVEERFEYRYPQTLVFKGVEHRLNKNGVPQIIFSMAYEQRSYKLLVSDITARVKKQKPFGGKDLNNFRDTLRTKFEFPSDEKFIVVSNGEVHIKSELFDLGF